MNDVFRFQAPSNIAPNDTLQRLVKHKPKLAAIPTLIAADKGSFRDSRGRWPIETYASLPDAYYVTLTCREADLIALANPGRQPPLALEVLHPWLPRKKYREDSERNYEALSSVFSRYGHRLVSPATYCDQMWNRACNSVRMKSDLDLRFFTAWHLPVQDCYIFEENRLDRSIVAIDFNAMYPSCMQQKFPRPSMMRRVVYDREITSDEILPMGLYRCKLQGQTSNFIRKYNPFRTFFAGRHLQAALADGLLVDLNEFEVAFYRRHFSQVYVVDAIISDQNISHPLAREARRAYARRAHYLAHDNKALADREKFLSTLLASCTHRPGRSCRRFKSRKSAEDYLRDSFGIVANADDPRGLAAPWLQGRKAFMISETLEEFRCETPNIASGRACYVFNQRIVAQGRVILLEVMEKLTAIAPGVELCYANVDSVHFSIPSDYLDLALENLRSKASGRMGDYKIEAVARGGLWLEPGRYWLYSDRIEKFRNRSIRHGGLPFEDHSIHVASRKIGDIHVPIKRTISMGRSMTDMRSIEYDPAVGIERQQLAEVGKGVSLTEILSKLEHNRRHGIPRRLEAFRKLARCFDTAGTRCLETQQKGQV